MDREDKDRSGDTAGQSHPDESAGQERLQKIIAAAGITSRRKAEELIVTGRVQVNGKVVTELGTKANLERDHIRVDGKLLHGAERHRYFLLNKPKGYVTTVSDPEGRHTVMEFFRGNERVFPVGRLDYMSEGLLLLTNDGDLANALTRAAAKVEKTYLVKVSGKPSDAALEQLRSGIMIDRGRAGSRPGERSAPRKDRVMTAPAKIRLARDAENPWYEIVLIEGRNRELRRMFEEVGHHVEKIRRVGYGPLVLDVEPGKLRELDPQEVEALKRAGQRRTKATGKRNGPVPAAAKLKSPRPQRRSDRKPRPGSRRPD